MATIDRIYQGYVRASVSPIWINVAHTGRIPLRSIDLSNFTPFNGLKLDLMEVRQINPCLNVCIALAWTLDPGPRLPSSAKSSTTFD